MKELMKIPRYLLILATLVNTNVIPMDYEPDLILELVWRFGNVRTLGFFCTMALLCKKTNEFSMDTVRERKELIENNYKGLLSTKNFSRGALVTISKTHNLYGFIGIDVLSEESCAHGEHCRLHLVKAHYHEDVPDQLSWQSKPIAETWGDPEPEDKKYAWIENLKQLSSATPMQPLKYKSCNGCDGDRKDWDLHGPITISKLYFGADGSLSTVIDCRKLTHLSNGYSIAEDDKREFKIA